MDDLSKMKPFTYITVGNTVIQRIPYGYICSPKQNNQNEKNR